MVPFGKQQDILRDLSTSRPEELSGNCRETVYEDGLVVISNEKSARVYRFPRAATSGAYSPKHVSSRGPDHSNTRR